MLRYLVLAALGLTLVGCSNLTPKPDQPTGHSALTWQAHEQSVRPISQWNLSGKLGLRSPAQSGSALLTWYQDQQYFDIRLNGPLGQGATRLSGQPGRVRLDISSKGSFVAESAETLMQQELGWSLPVEFLLSWAKGLPVPKLAAHTEFDEFARLSRLQQAGWNIHYLDYESEAQGALPTRMKVSGHNLQLTLVIKEWNAQSAL
ncbi:lipoprotein insertase outer membrane protein LolB [Thiopseudomonas alkaliphila]|uniref:lipoprotein insertase outer membrane protein LolB n=1 Tax=Thiopseudomonas alkaliphila TaxID=1697053 RepID=UPI003570BDE1